MHFLSQSMIGRLALIGVLAAALGLSACGRKGLLDPPPGASLEGVAQPNAPRLISTNRPSKPAGAKSDSANPDVDENGQPRPSQGPNKRIPLDNLLN